MKVGEKPVSLLQSKKRPIFHVGSVADAHGNAMVRQLEQVFTRLDASGFEEGFRDRVQEAFELTAG